MMKNIIAWSILCLLFHAPNELRAQESLPTATRYSVSSIPDSLKENSNSVIRYFNREILIKSPGKAIIKEHVIQTILNENDEDETTFVIPYDRKFSEINTAEFRVYDKYGNLLKRIKKGDFYDRSAVDGISLITDSRILVASYTAPAYPITIEKMHEISFSSFLDLPDWQIQTENVSVEHGICKIAVKPEIGFRYHLINIEKEPVKGMTGEYEIQTWDIKGLKALEREQNSKAWKCLPRIAFATSVPPLGEADVNCQQGVRQTVELLEQLGHQVEQKSPDFSGLIEPFQVVWQAGVAASGIPVEVLQPMNRWLFARTGSVAEYLRAVSQMQIVARQIVAFFDTVDVLVLPVYLHSPIRVGEWAALSSEEAFENIIRWVAPCPAANATGQPAIALPVGFDSNGLPISVQLVGKPAAEATLISLAAQIEAAKPWIQHRPAFAT